MSKSADAFRTISEVAGWLATPTHVLRFWESKFSQIKPVKRAGGRRYYRPQDMLLIGGIKQLLHEDGLTIKGAQKVLREQGAKHVSSLSQPLGLEAGETPDRAVGSTPTQDKKTADWQPIHIADFATEVSDNKATNLLNSDAVDFVDASAYSMSQDDTSPFLSAAIEQGDSVQADTIAPDGPDESHKALNSDGVRGSSQEVMDQEPADVKKDFDKFQSSFDADQPALNFWAKDEVAVASEADAKAEKEPLRDPPPKVEQSFESVMNYLSLHDAIGKTKAMLLKPILLDLEKRLEQRQSRHFK